MLMNFFVQVALVFNQYVDALVCVGMRKANTG
jgi:hypothetical protein